MYPSRISSATHSLDPGPIGLLPIPAHPANSRCQTHIPLVHYFLGTPAAASVTSRYPHSAPQNAPKTASFLCNLSPLDATLLSSLLCVANKELAQYLSLLDATLTKNTGGGGPTFGLSHPLARHRKSVLEEQKCALTP